MLRYTQILNAIDDIREHYPIEHTTEVHVFPQTWSSTALGFGGIGGQAITDAYTVVGICHETGRVRIYFGGRFWREKEYDETLKEQIKTRNVG